MPRPRKLRIATCQFSEDWNPTRNAVIMRRYIAAAARKGADVVHFHECALSGYFGGGMTKNGYDPKNYDWAVLRIATESILAEAARRRVWVVFGSSHPLTPPHKPHNCLYVVSPRGKIIDRYDKRFCTEGDLEVYSPGDHFVSFTINGLTCSCLICYDLRFPELYRELARMGVRVLFDSFHNGRHKDAGIWAKIMRQTAQAHAGINAMWISMPNSSAYFSCWPSVFITPDGRIARQLRHNAPGLMVNTVDPAKKYYDASGPYRALALRGILNTGTAVTGDPRSDDRTCF
ncbi:MAG: carbon-nitrogen hydrolase family protein [Phycisphaerae bacterium]